MFGLRLARSRARCTFKARRSWRAFFAPGFSTNAKRANDIAPVDCAEARAKPSGCWQWMMLLRTAVPLEAHQQHTPKLHTQHVAIHCLRGNLPGPLVATRRRVANGKSCHPNCHPIIRNRWQLTGSRRSASPKKEPQAEYALGVLVD
jgi:hypothetical protein